MYPHSSCTDAAFAAWQVLLFVPGVSSFLQEVLAPAAGIPLEPPHEQSHPQQGQCQQGEAGSLAPIVVVQRRLEGLLTDPHALAAATEVLERMYAELYQSAAPGAGEIDERLFIGCAEGDDAAVDDAAGVAGSASGGRASLAFRWARVQF